MKARFLVGLDGVTEKLLKDDFKHFKGVILCTSNLTVGAASLKAVGTINAVEPDMPDVRHALIAHDNAVFATVPVPLLPHQRPLDGLRLLVVEDNALNRQVAFELLAVEGAQVDLADDGQQGVDMATNPSCAYDAVVMDVQMPGVDGLEATHRIRSSPSLSACPSWQ